MDECFQLLYQTSVGPAVFDLSRKWRRGLLDRLTRQLDFESKRVKSEREEAKERAKAEAKRKRQTRRY